MTDQQHTIADILEDLPKIRQIAGQPMAQNPLLAVVLQQAQALAQIAQWTVDAEKVALAASPPLLPSEMTNGHAEMPVQGEVLEMPGGRKRGAG